MPKGDTKKPTPRRLFSFDSLKSSSARRSSVEASGFDGEQHIDQHRHGESTRFPVNRHGSNHDKIPEESWTNHVIVESPRTEDVISFRPPSPGPGKLSSVPKLESRKPVPLTTGVGLRPTTPESDLPPSPSQVRWEHLRQHVLPPPPPPSQPPAPISVIPPPQTPKPSRLARLGFKHVVEHVRDVAVDDSRKFALELQKAFWSARYADPSKFKADREPYTATMGSTIHFPFMSTSSLGTAGVTSTTNLALSNKKHEIRRPQSVQSLNLPYHSVPSLKHLYQTLLQHSTPLTDGSLSIPNLPYEYQVLSFLLGPFLSHESGARPDEERWFAIEAFEFIIKTWDPSDELSSTERSLWCCQAAITPLPALRIRILRTLWNFLMSSETRYTVTTPHSLQALAHGLFSLLPLLQSAEENKLIKDIISQIRSGGCGDLDTTAVEEEYNAIFLENDVPSMVCEALVLEALTRCLLNCSEPSRRWQLHNSMEEFWSMPTGQISFTPLLTAIHVRILNNFSQGSLAFLFSESSNLALKNTDTSHIIRLLQIRAIPEIESISGNNASESRGDVIRIILEFVLREGTKGSTRWALSVICHWYNEGLEWKSSFEKVLERLLSDSDWPIILEVLLSLVTSLPDDVRKPIVAFVMPILNDQLLKEPPPYPCQHLTTFLDTISRLYPQLFYKPLFACAASVKEFSVVNHLRTIIILSKFLPDFWTRDAEMISVALMSHVGGTKPISTAGTPEWGKARLGQSVLFLELIGHIQAARHEKEGSLGSEGSSNDLIKFVLTLESRFTVLLEAKEQVSLVPLSQRLLFCLLFREIRLLTRSMRLTAWLPRVVSWFIDYVTAEGINEDLDMELNSSISQIQGLYAAANEGVRSSHKRRSTMLLSSSIDELFSTSISDRDSDISTVFAGKAQLIATLSKGFMPKAMKLLVTMSTLLTPSDYRRLSSLVWYQCLSDTDASVIASACFIIMQCAEKCSTEFLGILEADFQSADDNKRMEAVRKIGVLSNWRFQIMSQPVLIDRAHRPFKLARGPLPYVTTDIGTSLYIREDDPDELKDNLPLELRKRLAEIGWTEEDVPVDQQSEWVRTPMSLLPSHQLDRLESTAFDQFVTPSPNITPMPSPQKGPSSGDKLQETGLLRRNSSTGGPSYGIKRRAVFVPSLALIFPRLASMVLDSNYAIAAAARHLIVDLMRNDAALLTRPVMDLLVGSQRDIPVAVSTLSAFLHVQRVLPPAMTHNVFNNIAGFLKFAARQDVDVKDALYDFAHTIPILAKLVTQVGGMSIREIRRAKLEVFLIPSGSLWFQSSAPVSPMFPRNLRSGYDPFEEVPAPLISITMIRVSQNMLFLSMLKRNHQDVQLIRKNISPLMLPSRESQLDAIPLEIKDFAPSKLAARKIGTTRDVLQGLSLMLARSYLLLVAQVFRSMPRHLNDRNELALLIDGLNRILLTHGDDIGVVGQALIALMVASTRFRRLFTSGGGYTLFMSAVFKVYCESESHPGIKLAIEYAVDRFYALHKEAFIFQTLDTIGHIMMLPTVETAWLAKSVFSLFLTLRKGIPPSTPDAAGIYDANKLQEREALIVSTAEEKPQTFLSLLRKGEVQSGGQVTIDLPEEYESSRLGIADLVRLFLTVIAHDPSIARAEQFLRLLRFIAPHLYRESSSARLVLEDGIDALGVVLTRVSTKTKYSDAAPARSVDEGVESFASNIMTESQMLDKSKMPSDVTSMKLDYLSLITALICAGGSIQSTTSNRVIELVKTMLRDSTNEVNESISIFFTEYTRASLIRDNAPSLKAVVVFLRALAPIISAYGIAVDFTGVFETVLQLANNPLYARESTFSQVIVIQIIGAGLTTCELAASSALLSTLPCRASLISLMAQAVLLRGSDLFPEIEKRAPSYDFLANIVLPLALALKTGVDMSDSMRTEPWHRNAVASVWVRLLSYTMEICQRRSSSIPFPSSPARSKSQDKRRSTGSRHSRIPTFVIALQILKTIIIRAEADLSSHVQGVWSMVASFLKSVLIEGNAQFALRSQEHSPATSPAPSPRASGQWDHFNHSSISAHIPGRSFLSPRIVDYSLWSILELLCAYRTPLLLQMRLFVIEKVVALHQELDYQNVLSSPGASPRDHRISSVFSKPRRRMSGLHSPQSSVKLNTSQSFPLDTSFLTTPDGRQAGFNFPPSPSTQNTNGPRIVHLGPISNPSAFRRSLSPGGGTGMRFMAKSTKIKSLALVRATYQRIRVVQSYMGYDVLLPMPNSGIPDKEEVIATAWTRHQALEAVIKETHELMDEFEETFGDNDHMVVDSTADQSE